MTHTLLQHNSILTSVLRRLLLLIGCVMLAAVLLPSHSARAAPGLVQSNGGHAGNTFSVPFIAPNFPGDLIVVATNWTINTGVTASVSDSLGNLYATATGPLVNSGCGTNYKSIIWFAKNIIGGSNTVTITLSGAVASVDAEIHEYAGANTTSPLDAISSQTGFSTSPDSGSAATNSANEMVFGYGVACEGAITGPGSGFVLRQNVNGNGTEDKNVASVGSYNATFAHNATPDHWSASMATFKSAAGTQVTSRSDTLNNSQPSATSNHTISFTTNTAIYGSSTTGSSTLQIILDPNFTIPSGMNCGDIDVATGTQFAFNYPACQQTSTAWGFSATGSVITIIPPSGTATLIATGTPITVYIGSNATYQQQGAHWLTNPAASGIYTISIGGTFGGSGNIPVAITSGVTLQGIIPETLSFTVSPSVTATTFITYQAAGSGSKVCSSATSGGCFVNTTLAAGQLVVVMVTYTQTPVGAGVTDSAGNSYVSDVYDPGSGSTWLSRIYHTVVGPGQGGSGITVKFTTSPVGDYIDMHVLTFSAANGWLSSPLDRSNHAGTGSQPTSPVTMTAGTTAQAMELMVGHFGDTNGNSPSNTDGWTRTWLIDNNSSASFYLTASTVTSVFFRINDSSNNSQNYDQMVATYMPNLTSCQADDGATITAINATATSVPFGNINANTFYQGCQDLTVSTNAPAGYSLSVQEKTMMQTANGQYLIPDTTCDNGGCNTATAASWVTPTKYGLGHTCYNQLGSDCNASFLNGTMFKPIPNVASNSGIGMPAFVQSATSLNGAVNSAVKAYKYNNIAGSLLVVSGEYGLNGSELTAWVSDTQGNLYATAVKSFRAGSQLGMFTFYAANAKGGPNTVTVTLSSPAGNWLDVILSEYSGVAASSPLDKTASSMNWGTAADSGNTALTTQANELLYGFGISSGGISGLDNAYTQRVIADGNTIMTADRNVSGTGLYQLTFSCSSACDWGAQIATFKTAPVNPMTTLMSNTGPTASSVGRAKYRLSVAPSQVAGTYTTVIVYTILGTF